MDFSNLLNLFKKNNSSAEDAKNRLKLVLVSDRNLCSPEIMEKIKNDIMEVLSKYVEIDKEKLNIELSKQENGTAICANIPINAAFRTK